jgi:hypothetical protein
LYFGYGLEADPDIMEIITGEGPVVVLEPEIVAMQGMNLAIQRLSQVPESGSLHPQLNPREILRQNWAHAGEGDNTGFYTMVPANEHELVMGTLYAQIQHLPALDRLAKWDMNGDWRTRQAGSLAVKKSRDGDLVPLVIPDVLTFTTMPNQKFDRRVNGEDYDLYLHGREAALQAARQFAAQQAAA